MLLLTVVFPTTGGGGRAASSPPAVSGSYIGIGPNINMPQPTPYSTRCWRIDMPQPTPLLEDRRIGRAGTDSVLG